MCGRYNITDDPLFHALLDKLGVAIGSLPTRYNIAPTESVPVIRQFDNKRVLTDMRWWLAPSWSDGPSTQYAMFNARAENLEKSPAFRGPFKHKRAIMPASSFIEWQKVRNIKQPYLIKSETDAIAFAALWDRWEDGGLEVYSCCIITTEATPSFKSLHTRMPVMLRSEAMEIWLNEEAHPAQLKGLMQPALPGPLQITPISRSINNAKIKDPPIAEDDSFFI